jgi:hypothetical protein
MGFIRPATNVLDGSRKAGEDRGGVRLALVGRTSMWDM